MSDVTENEMGVDENGEGSGRKLAVFLGGMTLLGVALALLLFGGALFGGGEGEPAAVDDAAPNFVVQTPVVASVDAELGNVQVGEVAPDFGLADLEGTGMKLSDFEGRPVIINFWASWCAPCRIEMPELQDTYNAYQDEGLVILAVNREEDPQTVEGYFVDEMGLTFTPLLDQTGAVGELYGVFNMPTTYFVNGAGEVTAVHRGPMNRELIEEYLGETIQ